MKSAKLLSLFSSSRCARAAALLCLSWPVLSQAQVTHLVQPSDTLYGLAQRYLDNPNEWKLLQSVNQVRDPVRLMPGRTVLIPAALLRAPPATAEVLHVAGQASSVQGDHPGPGPLVTGQRLSEGSRIEVGDGGFVSLRLADGSVVRLATGTALQLRELRHEPASGRSQSSLQLERGRVDATVEPVQPASRSRFEVRTPLAVGGVRGTTFGVAVADNGDFIGDVREGSIQIQPLAAPSGRTATLVRAGEGARVGTNAEGAVEVARLLPAPDLTQVPSLVEDIAWIELPLPAQASASGWQVHIASGDGEHRVVRNATFAQPLARFSGLADGDYRLAVRTLNAQGMPGNEAVRDLRVNARPQAPLMMEPRQDSRVPAPNVELSCTENVGAEGHRFEVARDAAFTDVVANSHDVATCRHVARALTPGLYHWRVASVARDVQGQRDQGPFSKPLAFTVAALPPAPSQLQMRSEGLETLRLQWSASPNGPWRHHIQIARSPDFATATLLDDRELTQAAYARALPPPGNYHVRVRQIDAFGLQGPWSDTQTLEVPARVLSSDRQPLMSSDGRPVAPGAR